MTKNEIVNAYQRRVQFHRIPYEYERNIGGGFFISDDCYAAIRELLDLIPLEEDLVPLHKSLLLTKGEKR